MTIDLCVINYNTRDKLQRFLDVLHADYRETDPKVWNLHIADNGSTDDSVDWLKENFESYDIDTIHTNENIGYAGAANDLAWAGSGDVIAILNADVWMSTTQVRSIRQAFQDPEVAILGPKQRDEQGRITHAGIIGTHTAPRHRGWREPDPMDTKYRFTDEVVTVSGSAYFVRRNVWDELTNNEEYNLMLKEFRARSLVTDQPMKGTRRGEYPGAFLPTRHYYEETWVSYFAHHLGHKVVYDGRISIGHSWHASSEVGGHADQLFHESKQIFVAACDHFGIPHD